MHRNRYLYFVYLTVAVVAGLASRHFATTLPQWVQLYVGDAIWALMVFLLFGFVFRTKSSRWVAICAIAFSYSIELSQLYHAPWIDAVRGKPMGGLVLGFGFLWSDLVSYALGVCFGYAMEIVLLKR